jgi:hypothetical protein
VDVDVDLVVDDLELWSQLTSSTFASRSTIRSASPDALDTDGAACEEGGAGGHDLVAGGHGVHALT